MEFNRSTTRGFSLIELMFVIAIIAAIAVMGLAAYKQRVMNQKIDQTVLQLQTILQGSMAYYVANNHWPNDSAASFNTMLTDYVGVKDIANFISPFGGNYQTELNPKDTNYFTVYTIINTTAIEPELAGRVAELISRRLPIARFNQNSHTVYASVPIPAQASGSNEQEKVIYDVKVIQSGTLVKKPDCPVDRIPELDVAMNGFVPTNADGRTRIIRQVITCNDKANPSGPGPDDFLNCNPNSSAREGFWQPTIDLLAGGSSQGGQDIRYMKLLAITSCKLKSSQNKAAGSLNNYNFVF